MIWHRFARRERPRRRPGRRCRIAVTIEPLEARRLLAVVTVLDEDFAALTSGNSTSTTGSSVAWSGSADWPNVAKAFQAGGAVRLGTSSLPGSLTSRSLDLSGGPVTVSFAVKGWTSVEGSLVVTVSGQPTQTVSYVATMSGAFETKSLTFSAGQAAATISFATTAKRAFLDDIFVTVETGPPLVHAIRGLAWNDADGDGVRDEGEPGLAGWTIYLDLDSDGELDGGEPTTTTAADGSYAFTDLLAGTYSVAQVVAFGWEQTAPPITEATASGRTPRTIAAVAPVRSAAEFVGPLQVRQHATRLIPNDPLFSQQWHLRNTGQSGGTAGEDIRVTTAWDRVRGSGVVIGIVDDGLQSTHPDLSGRYVSALSYDFNGNDSNPAPGAGDDHGTAVAGIAAATGNNGIGVSGVAPAASLAGLRLVAAATTDAQEAAGLTHRMQDIDIYNNSWGPDDTGDNLEAPGPLTLAALKNGVENGRGGLGSIYVWAAGNGLMARRQCQLRRLCQLPLHDRRDRGRRLRPAGLLRRTGCSDPGGGPRRRADGRHHHDRPNRLGRLFFGRLRDRLRRHLRRHAGGLGGGGLDARGQPRPFLAGRPARARRVGPQEPFHRRRLVSQRGRQVGEPQIRFRHGRCGGGRGSGRDLDARDRGGFGCVGHRHGRPLDP